MKAMMRISAPHRGRWLLRSLNLPLGSGLAVPAMTAPGRFLPVAHERELTSSDIARQMQSRLRQSTKKVGPILLHTMDELDDVVLSLHLAFHRFERGDERVVCVHHQETSRRHDGATRKGSCAA
jgi:hypothetical protein